MVMEYKDIKIIIPTCNQYLGIVRALIYTLNKFWPNHGEIIILGYDSPNFELDNKTSFVSMGKQLGPKEWSNDLIKFFNQFKDEFFINMIDYTLMTRKADEHQIKYLFELIKKDDLIGKIFLHGSLTSFNKYETLKNDKYDLILINQNCEYRSSIQSAIWRTSYFLQMLKPNLSPWEFELQHIKNDGVKIISTKTNHPTMYSHLYRVGGKFQVNDWYKSVFEPTQLPDEDIKLIKEMLKL